LTGSRAILHDPVVYPEPDAFKPERFLDKDGNLREDSVIPSAFGYGRRICPGRHLAEITFFMVAASLFSVFKIERGEDASGTEAGYPYTGAGLKCAHSISNLGEVANLSSTDHTAVHNRSCAPSSQEIKGQRN
jgi:cytochrome P450